MRRRGEKFSGLGGVGLLMSNQTENRNHASLCTGHTNEDVESFYDDITEAMSENQTNCMLFIIDINAKIRCQKYEDETAFQITEYI